MQGCPFSSSFNPKSSKRAVQERLKELCASVAQLVEQLICNQRVGGSNPLAGLIIKVLPIWAGTEVVKRGGL